MEETSDPMAVLNVNLVGGAKVALSIAAAFCFVALSMDFSCSDGIILVQCCRTSTIT